MIKHLFVIISAFLLTNCQGISRMLEPTPDHVRVINKITDKYKKEVFQKDGLIYLGGGGGMMGDIYLVSLDFNTYKKVDIPSARQLIVRLEEEYLDMVNSSQEVRPYLHNYPFDLKNVELRIFFSFPESFCAVPPPHIAIVGVCLGEVRYSLWSEGFKDKLKKVHSESYEEAYKIVYGHEKSFTN